MWVYSIQDKGTRFSDHPEHDRNTDGYLSHLPTTETNTETPIAV